MKLASVVTTLSLVGAVKAAPPQPQRTSDLYKWRPGKIECATMASARGQDIHFMMAWLEIRDVKFYVPPVPHCYRPQCFATCTASVYVCHNNTKAIAVQGRHLAHAMRLVRDNCCVHEGFKDFQKSGTVSYPAAGVKVHVGAADCFNKNDWVNPLTINGPNNCLMDAKAGAPVYIPGVNHTDAYEV